MNPLKMEIDIPSYLSFQWWRWIHPTYKSAISREIQPHLVPPPKLENLNTSVVFICWPTSSASLPLSTSLGLQPPLPIQLEQKYRVGYHLHTGDTSLHISLWQPPVATESCEISWGTRLNPAGHHRETPMVLSRAPHSNHFLEMVWEVGEEALKYTAPNPTFPSLPKRILWSMVSKATKNSRRTCTSLLNSRSIRVDNHLMWGFRSWPLHASAKHI